MNFTPLSQARTAGVPKWTPEPTRTERPDRSSGKSTTRSPHPRPRGASDRIDRTSFRPIIVPSPAQGDRLIIDHNCGQFTRFDAGEGKIPRHIWGKITKWTGHIVPAPAWSATDPVNCGIFPTVSNPRPRGKQQGERTSGKDPRSYSVTFDTVSAPLKAALVGIPAWSHFAPSVRSPLPTGCSAGERGPLGHPKFCGLVDVPPTSIRCGPSTGRSRGRASRPGG